VCLDALGGKGVAKALSAAHLPAKTLIAMDSDPETLECIRKGFIQGTIAQTDSKISTPWSTLWPIRKFQK
jgi:ABC-type sugar transport system substrate-binding protein